MNDAREIEVLASGLPMHHGAHLAVDITLRSAVSASGEACANAVGVNGAVLHRARSDITPSTPSWLKGIVASWSFRLRPADVGVTKPSGSSTLWVQLVLVMPLPVLLAWRRRWTRMLAFSCSRAFAGSFFQRRGDGRCGRGHT